MVPATRDIGRLGSLPFIEIPRPDESLRDGNLAAGGGLSFKTGNMEIGIDYTFVNELSEIFDNSHRIGFSVNF